MSIYTTPGAVFEATVTGAPTGLEGTIGVQIVDAVTDTVVTARTTAGIAEFPAGSGIYAVSLTAPTTAGTYQVVWDQGSITPTTVAAEDLVVTYSASPASVPSGIDLCTVAQVRAWLGKPAGDTAQDGVIADFITRASRAILTYLDREVVANGTNPQTRTFDLGGYGWDRVIPVGDLQTTPTAVVVLNEDGSTYRTLTVASDVQVQPQTRWAWQPVTHLRLRASAGTLLAGQQLRVTGSWGWPTVPEDITQAAVMTAGTWVRRYVQAFTTSYAPEQVDDGAAPESIPGAARALLAPYRMPALA